jgi:hypothetical protein
MERRDGSLANMFDLASNRFPRLFDCGLKSRHHTRRLFAFLFDQTLRFSTERQSRIEVALDLTEQGAICGLLDSQRFKRARCIIQAALQFARHNLKGPGFGLIQLGFRHDILLQQVRAGAHRYNKAVYQRLRAQIVPQK